MNNIRTPYQEANTVPENQQLRIPQRTIILLKKKVALAQIKSIDIPHSNSFNLLRAPHKKKKHCTKEPTIANKMPKEKKNQFKKKICEH